MADSTHYEVRCERCETSFAPGTKQCIHCGGAIGRRLLSLEALGGGRAEAAASAEQQTAQPDAQPNIGRLIRIVLIGLGILAAFARVFFEGR
jgi:hypothetical protein